MKRIKNEFIVRVKPGMEKKGINKYIKAESYSPKKLDRINKRLARTLIGAPGNIIDLPGLLYNIPAALTNGPTFSVSEELKKKFDKFNEFNYKPSNRESLEDAFLDSTIGFGGAKSLINKIPKGINLLKKMLTPTAGGAASSVLVQNHLNKKPEDVAGALAIGALTPTVFAIPKSVKNIANNFRLGRLKRSPALQEAIEIEIGKIGGAEDISKMSKEYTGNLLFKGANKQKKNLNKYFDEKYNIFDDYIDQHGHKPININSVIDSLIDDYTKLNSKTAQQKFLKTESGKLLPELLKMKQSGKITYNDARFIQKHIQNLTSRAEEIGTGEQGRLKSLQSLLTNDLSKIYKEPEMRKDWFKTNEEYMAYATHKKPLLNKTLKHKPLASDKGKPSTAFEEFNYREPEDLKFIIKGLSSRQKDLFAKGYLNHLGHLSSNDNINPLKLNSGLSSLDKPIKETLLNALNSEAKAKLGKQNELVTIYKNVVKTPFSQAVEETITPYKIKKGINLFSNFTNQYKPLDRSKVKSTISALESQLKPKQKSYRFDVSKASNKAYKSTNSLNAPKNVNSLEDLTNEELDALEKQLEMQLDYTSHQEPHKEDSGINYESLSDAELDAIENELSNYLKTRQ